MAEDKKKMKFIRKGGRIIPIGAKKNKPKATSKPKQKSSGPETYAGAGAKNLGAATALLGATIGAIAFRKKGLGNILGAMGLGATAGGIQGAQTGATLGVLGRRRDVKSRSYVNEGAGIGLGASLAGSSAGFLTKSPKLRALGFGIGAFSVPFGALLGKSISRKKKK